MDLLTLKALKQAFQEGGSDLLEDLRRCEALIRDHVTSPSEQWILVSALREQIPQMILSAPDAEPIVATLRKLAARLHGTLGLARDASEFAVEVWGMVVGALEPGTPRIPKPSSARRMARGPLRRAETTYGRERKRTERRGHQLIWIPAAIGAGILIAVLVVLAAVRSPELRASFSIFPGRAAVDEEISFDASRSRTGSEAVDSFAWDFGDGTFGQGVFIRHAYAAPGEYIVALCVTSAKGSDDTCSQVVVVDQTWPL